MNRPVTQRVRALATLIENEIHASEREQLAIATLDVEVILRRAEQRTAFSDEIKRLVTRLGPELPPPAERSDELKAAMRHMRDAATALTLHQTQNQTLLRRALDCVKGTLRALAPQTVAYGPGAGRARPYGTLRQTYRGQKG